VSFNSEQVLNFFKKKVGDDMTILHRAVNAAKFEVVKLLLESGTDPDIQGGSSCAVLNVTEHQS
jgi:ankyrin repeat protein